MRLKKSFDSSHICNGMIKRPTDNKLTIMQSIKPAMLSGIKVVIQSRILALRNTMRIYRINFLIYGAKDFLNRCLYNINESYQDDTSMRLNIVPITTPDTPKGRTNNKENTKLNEADTRLLYFP